MHGMDLHASIGTRIWQLALEKQPSLEKKISGYRSDTRIADLGLDSLALIEIIFQIETETGVSIDESQLVGLNTLGQLAGVLAGQERVN